MTKEKVPFAARFLPSLTDAAFLAPLLFLFFRMNGTHTLLGDGDTGWHIRTGEWILANHRVPRADMFSFTKPGQPWFAWEWLWDVCFAVLHSRWGLAAVVFGAVVILGLTFTLLFRLTRRYAGNDLIAIAVTLVAMAGSSIHWLARPHLVTLLFAVVFYMIVERAREGRWRLLYALPFLTVLWTNLHGGFIAGWSVLMAYAAGELIAAVLGSGEARREALRRARNFGITLAGCVAATFVNPYGYGLHVHIASYLTDKFQYEHITEFFPPNFQYPPAGYLEAMLLLGAATAYSCLKRREFSSVILVVAWAHLALISSRNIPLFLIFAAPLVARELTDALDRLKRSSMPGWLRGLAARFAGTAAEFGENDRITRVNAASAVVSLCLLAVLTHAQPGTKFHPEYDPKSHPAAALASLAQTGGFGQIFTEDVWGGYLIYKLHPRVRVFIDGRSDFYGADFDQKYLDILAVKHGWQQALQRYGVDTVLLPVSAPLAGALKESNQWRPVYDDGIAIVFRPSSSVMAVLPEASQPQRMEISAAARPRGVNQ